MLQFLLFCQFQLMIEFLPPFLGSRKCLKKQTNKQKQQQEKKTRKTTTTKNTTFGFSTQSSAWFESYLFNRSI